jgi:hypothetical protein
MSFAIEMNDKFNSLPSVWMFLAYDLTLFKVENECSTEALEAEMVKAIQHNL